VLDQTEFGQEDEICKQWPGLRQQLSTGTEAGHQMQSSNRRYECISNDPDANKKTYVTENYTLLKLYASKSLRFNGRKTDYMFIMFFSPEYGVGLVRKRGCLLTLTYYAFPR
jgi:hypothetical protein